MGAGKVDYENLWKNMQARKRHIRWRRLRLVTGASIVPSENIIEMFGYACHQNGPWFGYPKGSLQDAVCNHCGQTNIFQNESWRHHCPGHFPSGVQCPLLEDHLCRGEPSMANAPMWSADHYEEVE